MSPRPAGVRVGGRVGPPVPAPPAPARVRALLADGVRTLRAAGLATARQDAEWLLAEALGVNRLDLYTDPPAVGAAAARRYAAALARRAAHEPLQHLLGWEEFRGLRFGVGPAVLIPRPETELLVEWALEFVPPGATVCDLGTGSGCVAAAIATARPDARVLAVEVSAAARAVAARNLAALGLAARVTVLGGDLFEPLARWAGAVDLIVANPPYIPTGTLAALPAEVRAWEPRGALDGGSDGMAVSRRIIAGAPGVLARGGALTIEIGEGQAPPLAATMRARGFVDVTTRHDLGGVERYLAGAFGASAARGARAARARPAAVRRAEGG